jgi:hypothetical protein
MSHLVQAVLSELGVESKIALAGYHATTALAERYIRSVSKFIKAYIHDFPREWDNLLPFFAFNMRESARETTGFSAHELTFGRNLRNELENMRDDWLEVDDLNEKVRKNVISYITELRENSLYQTNWRKIMLERCKAHQRRGSINMLKIESLSLGTKC